MLKEGSSKNKIQAEVELSASEVFQQLTTVGSKSGKNQVAVRVQLTDIHINNTLDHSSTAQNFSFADTSSKDGKITGLSMETDCECVKTLSGIHLLDSFKYLKISLY